MMFYENPIQGIKHIDFGTYLREMEGRCLSYSIALLHAPLLSVANIWPQIPISHMTKGPPGEVYYRITPHLPLALLEKLPSTTFLSLRLNDTPWC
jgi:hypothetical protein